MRGDFKLDYVAPLINFKNPEGFAGKIMVRVFCEIPECHCGFGDLMKSPEIPGLF